jgi:hypothetical protein
VKLIALKFGIDDLRKIFPDAPNQVLVEAMLKGGSVEAAVNVLLGETTIGMCSNVHTCCTTITSLKCNVQVAHLAVN